MWLLDGMLILLYNFFSIKDTMRVPDDHTFGIMIKPDEYGVGDLLHQRPKCNYRRGHERENGLISAVRQQLKKANYHNFEHLQQAFHHYDKVRMAAAGLPSQ